MKNSDSVRETTHYKKGTQRSKACKKRKFSYRQSKKKDCSERQRTAENGKLTGKLQSCDEKKTCWSESMQK